MLPTALRRLRAPAGPRLTRAACPPLGAEKGRAWAGFPPAARPAPPASAGVPADARPGIRRSERAAGPGPSAGESPRPGCSLPGIFLLPGRKQ